MYVHSNMTETSRHDRDEFNSIPMKQIYEANGTIFFAMQIIVYSHHDITFLQFNNSYGELRTFPSWYIQNIFTRC